ncbi:MAG: restriction endonuclease subunit S [Lactobacillus sp.]|jgi:type I restriction enzyme S subunit|nr:restriction endonuclease subunit S [Lactobacillus sp.]MCI1942166.1 restriction endonuclease subunit S [Lactobacillus sp.]MCI1972550.1 restriction endonuclease subunit S [Lactobacillus sp.]MCI2037029.1 restriction endonuclease subunit S [Lactobacillus sp.]
MINKKRVVPQLRFRGFTDDWEQRKFSWMLDVDDGIRRGPFGSALKKSLFVPESPYAVYEQQNAIYDRYDTRYNISEKTFHELSKFEIRPGDFIMSGSGTIGRISRVPEGIKTGVFNQALIRFKIDDNKMDAEYFLQLIRSPQMQRRLTGANPGSAITNLVPMSEVKKWKLFVPTKAEQKQIARSLTLLDDAIALHQRKHELLLKLKQAYLQKLFPKYGNKIPELRFAGFTDDWEQRKLGEIAIRVRGNDGRMNLPTLTISAGNGWMDQRDRFSQNIAGKEQKNYTLLRQGELSYNHGNSKLAQFGAVFELESYNEALVPRVYHSFSVTADAQPKFIEQMFATHRPDRELRKLVSSGARMDGLLNINYDDFMGIKVWLPSMAEQQAIAGLLVKLDNTIALHQERLDQLKQLKKAYLQKLFV